MNYFTYTPDGIDESLLSILDNLLIKLSKTFTVEAPFELIRIYPSPSDGLIYFQIHDSANIVKEKELNIFNRNEYFRIYWPKNP